MAHLSGDDLNAALTDRHSCLRALIGQPRSKRELEEEIDCSRSTLDRAVRTLADAGFVRYEDGVWKLTLLGRCSYQTREAYLDRLDGLAEAAEILDGFSPNHPIDCQFLAGADVYKADPSMPDAVMQTLLDCAEQATEMYVATPVVVTGFAENFYESVRTGRDYTLEMLLPAGVFDRIHTTFPTLTNDLVNDPNVDLHRASIPFNFGLWIADADEVGVVVFADQGVRGILVNDTDDAVDWATDQYKRAKQDAEPILLRNGESASC